MFTLDLTGKNYVGTPQTVTTAYGLVNLKLQTPKNRPSGLTREQLDTINDESNFACIMALICMGVIIYCVAFILN
jgi:hypothetical protein